MKTNTTIFKEHTNVNYASFVDDYRRTKYFYFSRNIKQNSNIVFEKLCQSFKKSFKLSKDLEVGISFSLRINGISTKHLISEFSLDDKEIEISWNVANDQYWMTFIVKNKFFSTKKSIIKIKQIITRDKTFFGIQDFLGIHIYRNNFKKNCKEIIKAVKELIFLQEE